MKTILLTAVVLAGLAACGNGQTNHNDKNEKEMKTIELTKADFLTKVANYETSPTEWKYLGDKPALIDFYASWCGPCKMVAPILDELAAEYGDSIVIYKVNTEKEQELAAVHSDGRTAANGTGRDEQSRFQKGDRRSFTS